MPEPHRIAGHHSPAKLERVALRRAAERAAAHYDQAAVLQREIASRMAERLQYIRLSPARTLDLGCATGADMEALGRAYPAAQRIGCDWSPAMLARARRRLPALTRLAPWLDRRAPRLLCADAMQLPLRSGSVGLVWSNQMLHALDEPLGALREMLRVMEVGGLLMFSTLGPDTLKELRSAFGAADQAVHVQPFIDMHDVGDMLVAAGFAEPVMDMEVITLTYGDLSDLLSDLRHTASVNADPHRRRGLGGRAMWQQVREHYEGLRRDGRLPASFEVVYGHAWKAAPRVTGDGHAIVQFDRPRRARPEGR